MWNFKPNFKCLPFKFWGNPRPGLWCALTRFCQSLARAKKTFRGAPPRSRIIVCRKSGFGWVQTRMYDFMDSGPKFTGLITLNAGGIFLVHISFRFWISCLVPEIFAIKVGSCVKSGMFLAPEIFRAGPRIFRLHYKIDVYSDHVAKSRGDRPREVGDPMAN